MKKEVKKIKHKLNPTEKNIAPTDQDIESNTLEHQHTKNSRFKTNQQTRVAVARPTTSRASTEKKHLPPPKLPPEII